MFALKWLATLKALPMSKLVEIARTHAYNLQRNSLTTTKEIDVHKLDDVIDARALSYERVGPENVFINDQGFYRYNDDFLLDNPELVGSDVLIEPKISALNL